MTDDQFSKAFKDIVPDSPAPDAWADGAKKRRRNRRGIFAGVAGAAAIALAIPLALQLQDPAIVATPAESPTDGVAQPAAAGWLGAAACYESEGVPLQVDADAGAPAEGAVKAWLCGDATDASSMGTVGPLEPLVTGVDSLVDFITSQPELPPDSMCTMEYTLAYRVVLEYEDGSMHPVSGELHGCRGIHDGSGVRSGGEELYDLALGLWRDQRAAADDVDPVHVLPQCPPGNVMLVPSIDDITGAAVCETNSDGASFTQSEMHPDDVAVIVEDIRANAVDGAVESGWDARIALLSKWGEWLRLVEFEDGSGYWFTDADGAVWSWVPSAESAEILAGVLTDGGGSVEQPPVDPVEPVDPTDPGDLPALAPIFEPEGCVGVQDGGLVATDLDGGALADDPTAVWLCGNPMDPAGAIPAGPLESLTGAAAQGAVDLYNALPDADPMAPCTDDFGPSYLVVHQYADGSQSVVEIQEYGCRVVAAGETRKADGMQYLSDLTSLWTEQREADGTTGERPGPVCRAIPAIIAVTVADGFTTGWACPGAFGGTGVDALETQLSPELVQAVSDGMADSGFPLTGAHGDPTENGLVMLNQYGDPLQVWLMTDGTYQWWDGEQTMVWEPASAVATQLSELIPG